MSNSLLKYMNKKSIGTELDTIIDSLPGINDLQNPTIQELQTIPNIINPLNNPGAEINIQGDIYKCSNNELVLIKSPSLFDVSAILGIDLTGNIDCTQLILDAIIKYKSIWIPRGSRILIDNLQVPEDSAIYGEGTLVYPTTSNQMIRITGDKCVISGLKFRCIDPTSCNKVIVYVASAVNDTTIQDCFFLGQLSQPSYVAYEQWIVLEQNGQRNKVLRNTFNYGAYGVFAKNPQWCIINDNTMNSTVRSIQMYSGSYNKVNFNTINGRNIHYLTDTGSNPQASITGINFLTFGTFGRMRGILHNQVIGNKVSGISEEAISMDTHGNTPSDSAENPWLRVGTVSSVELSGTGNYIITLAEPVTQGSSAAPNTWWLETYVICMSGTNQGAIAKCLGGSASALTNTSTVVVPANAGQMFNAGDKLFFTYGILFNTIANNEVRNSHSGLALWGSGWYNKIVGNHVTGVGTGIGVCCVIATLTNGANDSGAPLGGVQGFCGCNVVSNNTIIENYYDQPSTASKTGTPLLLGVWNYGSTPAVTDLNFGNIVTDNMICSGRPAPIGHLGKNAVTGCTISKGTYLDGNRFSGGGSLDVTNASGYVLGTNFKGLGTTL